MHSGIDCRAVFPLLVPGENLFPPGFADETDCPSPRQRRNSTGSAYDDRLFRQGIPGEPPDRTDQESPGRPFDQTGSGDAFGSSRSGEEICRIRPRVREGLRGREGPRLEFPGRRNGTGRLCHHARSGCRPERCGPVQREVFLSVPHRLPVPRGQAPVGFQSRPGL